MKLFVFTCDLLGLRLFIFRSGGDCHARGAGNACVGCGHLTLRPVLIYTAAWCLDKPASLIVLTKWLRPENGWASNGATTAVDLERGTPQSGGDVSPSAAPGIVPGCVFAVYRLSPSRSVQESRRKKELRKKMKRYLLIGLATVGGGTVIGLTGGLAAPLVAAGAATIIGSAGAAVLGSTAGIAIMASLFGAAGAGLTGYKMKKRVGAIEEFEFLPLTGGRQLHICIAITGWLSTGKYGSFAAPWQSLLHSSEQYCLAWESKYLMELGSALDSLLNGLVNMVAQEALKFTILSGIVTALTWPASLITVASVIDNPWGVCLSRSAEVGKHLAHILLSRQQGRRPVTLIGFSLGARVIYFCLQELAQEPGAEGIIEDVVLLGAPVEGDVKRWKPLTRVVAGRIINGYCRGDWLLSFVYRSSSVKLNVAGLQPVTLDDRRMVNVDLSSVVNGHLDYMKQMDTLLKAVGIKTKECRLEEQSGLLQPLIGLAEGPPAATKDPEDTWDWEPISTDAQPSGPEHVTQCRCSEGDKLRCPDCTNNNSDPTDQSRRSVTTATDSCNEQTDSAREPQGPFSVG